LVIVGNAACAPEIRELPCNPYADPDCVDYRRNTNIETDVNVGMGAPYRFTFNRAIGCGPTRWGSTIFANS
jgi:hypothetical protein